jgi:hypothetical protein
VPHLVGLPGVRKKKIDCVFFQKPSQASRLLRNNRGLISASDNGSINVWIDDDGRYRANFCRHLVILAMWRGKKKDAADRVVESVDAEDGITMKLLYPILAACLTAFACGAL